MRSMAQNDAFPAFLFFMFVFVNFGVFLCVSGEYISGKPDVTYKREIMNRDVVYIEFPPTKSSQSEPFRISVSSNADSQFPVHVVVRQEKYITSWVVPLSVESSEGFVEFEHTARTLCWDEYIHHPMSRGRFQPSFNNFTVSLSTYSLSLVTVSIRVTKVTGYFLSSYLEQHIEFSPSQPVFYNFNFDQVPEHIKTVLVNVTSNGDDCFTVSIQDKRCPVYDLNDDINYKGVHLTASTKAGITITRNGFPQGFIVVFVAHADNERCIVQYGPDKLKERVKTNSKRITMATFMVKNSHGQETYLIGIFSLLSFNLLIIFGTIILTVAFYQMGKYKLFNKEVQDLETTSDKFDVIDGIQEKEAHTVADFVRKKHRIEKHSLNYFSHICNIGIFYGLPVIQLMVSYQRTVHDSGDLDMCYQNTYCSQPLYFTDFNHIYSNLGYIMFGAFFLAIVRFRQTSYHNRPQCGVPRHYGLYYAMGVALIFEGVLSACYHICPNQHNFQFDTSFMYVMAMLLTAKLYQNRHCDYDVSVYGFCSILAFLVFVALIGILTNSKAIMIFFIAIYLLFCVYMSFKLYFFAHVLRRFHEIFSEKLPLHKKFVPIRLKNFALILTGNILNFGIAAGGIFLYPKYVDFGTFILGILMVNLILYALFYTAMKVIKGERICWEATLYGLVSLITWLAGGYFFISYTTMWSLSPAKSRELNQDCILLNFYDTHDVWHVISSLALFTSFMFMLSLDDDLGGTPQTNIDVF